MVGGFGGMAGALSGLSAVNQGFQQGEANELTLDKAKQAALGKTALGNALQMLSQQQAQQPPMGGPSPMPQQGGPPPPQGGPPPGMPPGGAQPPPPGQMSQPMQPRPPMGGMP